MQHNFLVEISDLKSLKKNNINFDNANIYCIWYDKNELEKILIGSQQTNSHTYLSCFFSSITDKFPELIESYIMIFLKNPKILYGFAKVHSIILKDIPTKSYLEDINEELISQLRTNSLILIDDIEFNDILKKYKYIEVPKMFLVKIHYLYYFKYEIGIKKFNDYVLNSKSSESKNLEFKYPSKVQNKEIIKLIEYNFIDNLMKYIKDLHNKDKIINTSKLTSEITNMGENLNNNLIQKNKFCIPVLWNGCECIKNMLVHQTTKPNKKIIVSHYLNCGECEINDNNNKMINPNNNKKITIKNINENTKISIFDSLIDSYKNIKYFDINNNDFEIEKDKLNIISCSQSTSIYSKCLFLVE